VPIPYDREPQILLAALKQNAVGGIDFGATVSSTGSSIRLFRPAIALTSTLT